MNRFIGTWKLNSFEMKSDEGEILHPFGQDCLGYIMYNSDGYMSVAFMKSDRPKFSSDDIAQGMLDEKALAMDTFVSYCGTYDVDEERIVHRIEISWFPNWSGIDQVRFYEFSENRLTLKTPPMNVQGKMLTGYLVWERVQPH